MEPIRDTKTHVKGSRRDNTDQILPALPPSLDYPREITLPATLPANKRAALDLAIIGVLADGGLRRSEAAALTWGDVELRPDGTGRLTVQKGKNQVEPATVAVTAVTATASGEMLPEDVDLAAPVFGLTGEALANRVRAAAKAAGLGDGFTGHSGRIGMARRMVAAGAPNAAVQNQGRWKHGAMVARYTRGQVAGEALKWLV